MIAFPKLLLLWTAFFMLAIGLPALFAPKTFKTIMERSLKNSDLVRTWAFITLIIGLLFLTVYQSFNNGWAMLFPIIGYLSLIKGLVLLWIPNYGYNKFKWFFSSSLGSMITGILVLVFSLFLIRVALIMI